MELKDYLPHLSYLGTVAATVAFFFWATITGFRRRSADARRKLEESQDALIKVIKDEAIAWKNRYETEHAEYWSYRQKVHDNAKETQAEMLKLTAENADLRAKTDITPILKFNEDQQQINQKVIALLDSISQRLTKTT